MNLMKNRTPSQQSVEKTMSGPTANTETHSPTAKAQTNPAPPHKSKLDKTQSLLTVISTSIGLMGVAGSALAMSLSTLYTGAVEVRPDADAADVVVRVYSKDGHESVFHTKHIDLMPGDYHLEISSGEGRVAHADTRVRFHKTNTIPVIFRRSARQIASAHNGSANASAASDSSKPADLANMAGNLIGDLARPQQDANAEKQQPAIEAESTTERDTQAQNTQSGKKRHWWQLWKRDANNDHTSGDKE